MKRTVLLEHSEEKASVRNFKHLICAVFLSLVGFVVLVFVLENQQLSSLTFLGWTLAELPVSVFVLISFFSGWLVGLLIRFWLSCLTKGKATVTKI